MGGKLNISGTHMISPLISSLIVGMFVGGAAAYLGSLMITKRMALVGDALGHVALPGMGLALLLKIDPSIGALAFLMLGIFLIWKLNAVTALSLEILVGIIFVSSLAIGFLIVPEPELLESLIGDISKLSLAGVVISIISSVVTCVVVKRIYSGLMLLNISADLAFVEGISEKRYNLLYLAAVALIVAIGVRVTGSLLVGALVIVPPATARLISTNLRQYVRASTLIGVFSCVMGILISKITRFPTGPSIILVSAVLFLLSIVVRKTSLLT